MLHTLTLLFDGHALVPIRVFKCYVKNPEIFQKTNNNFLDMGDAKSIF